MAHRKTFRIQVMIQTTFISIFIVLSALLISLLTYTGLKSTKLLTNDLMVNLATTITQKLELEIIPAEKLTKLTQSLMSTKLITSDKMVEYTYLIAKRIPVQDLEYPERLVGWSDTQGNLVETSLQPDGLYTTTVFKKNAGTRHTIKLYRDAEGKIINQEVKTVSYNPLQMKWYSTAVRAKHFTWTGYFLSYPYYNPSIAAVTPLYDDQGSLQGVFEIEVKLVGLSRFLDSLKIGKTGQAFIVDDKELLYAYDGMQKNINQDTIVTAKSLLTTKTHPWLFSSLELYRKNKQPYFRYQYGKEYYWAYFQDIPLFKDQGLKIAVVVPENDFLGDIKKINSLCIVLGVFILIFGVFLVWVFAKHISTPIKLLVNTTNRIKQFDLDFNITIRSRVAEITLLRDAINSMKTGLKSFQKYLPSALVRQLIDSGQDASIGGSVKEITSFFSDIRGFTSISETMDSQQLMTHLCDYFDELSTIITSEQGTIDKYIGDSIMAFWGAPLDDSEHCYHACCAALRCQERLHELNLVWAQHNKPQFITGIGINTGEAIVGNLGSFDRINYTALGDSINLASRLESLSKTYGSKIIVSEDVVQAVKGRFQFEFIDKIEIRGKKGLHHIYELVSKLP